MKTIKKEDIKRIGHTTYSVGGYTTFICSSTTCQIESILLREILFLIGDYIITSEDDEPAGDGMCDWRIETNLPYSIYSKI